MMMCVMVLLLLAVAAAATVVVVDCVVVVKMWRWCRSTATTVPIPEDRRDGWTGRMEHAGRGGQLRVDAVPPLDRIQQLRLELILDRTVVVVGAAVVLVVVHAVHVVMLV